MTGKPTTSSRFPVRSAPATARRAMNAALARAAGAAIVLFALPGLVAAEWLELDATVAQVRDGNHVQVVDGKGIIHQVRLSSSDAPELNQPGGVDAWRRLRSLVENREVRIVHRFFDAHGRILGKMHVDGVWVNKVLVEEGLAWHADPDQDAPELKAVEIEAKEKKFGIWRRSNPVPPWHWRRGARSYRAGMEDDLPPRFPRYRSTNEPGLIGYP